MGEITPEITSHLIQQCYAAGMGTGSWVQFCDAFDQALGGVYVHLLAHDAYVHACVENVAPRYAEEFVTTYTQHYAAISPFVASLVSMPIGAALEVRNLFAYDELRRTEFYNDWMRPQEDICAGGGVVLFRNTSRMIHFGVHVRQKDEEAKLAQLMRLLHLLTPHLKNAFELSRLPLDKCLGGHIRAGSEVRDSVIPVSRSGLVADARSSVEGFEAFVRLGKLGKVEFLHAATQTAFEDALQSRTPRSFLARSVGVNTATAFALVVPSQGERLRARVGSTADLHAILTLSRLPTQEELRQFVMGRGLGFTPAEAEIVAGLVSGHSLRALATRRNVSIHTVRNQMRAIFERTGTRRQEELIAMLALNYTH